MARRLRVVEAMQAGSQPVPGSTLRFAVRPLRRLLTRVAWAAVGGRLFSGAEKVFSRLGVQIRGFAARAKQTLIAVRECA